MARSVQAIFDCGKNTSDITFCGQGEIFGVLHLCQSFKSILSSIIFLEFLDKFWISSNKISKGEKVDFVFLAPFFPATLWIRDGLFVIYIRSSKLRTERREG